MIIQAHYMFLALKVIDNVTKSTQLKDYNIIDRVTQCEPYADIRLNEHIVPSEPRLLGTLYMW